MRLPSWLQLIVIGALGALTGVGVTLWRLNALPAVLHQPLNAVVSTEPSTVDAIDIDYVRELLTLLAPADRNRILETDDSLLAFVAQEARNQAALSAAYAAHAERSAPVRRIMERAGQRVLIEAFMQDVMRQNLDSKYPTEADQQTFYSNNPAQFRVPDRFALWQIFIPATTAAERTKAQALARRLLEQLLSGKQDFATLATQYSGHEPSRLNGGYMGLVGLADLKPEVRAAVEGAPPDKLLGPLATNEGFHLVKRGPTVAGKLLEFEQVKDRIVRYLQQTARLDVMRQALDKMLVLHPVKFATADIAAWRTELSKVDFDSARGPQQ
ncbi:MAG: peptidylprolyl isomerase [Gammaproteobacteria bacterium]|nr:peptidylprolyl isomerase [Gammaproteobacteria bacterium]